MLPELAIALGELPPEQFALPSRRRRTLMGRDHLIQRPLVPTLPFLAALAGLQES